MVVKNLRRFSEYGRYFRISAILLLGLEIFVEVALADPLPSWNEGAAKQAIIKFVS